MDDWRLKLRLKEIEIQQERNKDRQKEIQTRFKVSQEWQQTRELLRNLL